MTTEVKVLTDEQHAEIDHPDMRIYAKIEFNYSCSYVMEYEMGLQLMASFYGAYQFDDSVYKEPKIKHIKDSPKMTLLTREQFEEYRMNTVLETKEIT